MLALLLPPLQGVEFWAVNTDAQALENTLSSNKLQLGGELTRGLGAPRYTLDSENRSLLITSLRNALSATSCSWGDTSPAASLRPAPLPAHYTPAQHCTHSSEACTDGRARHSRAARLAAACRLLHAAKTSMRCSVVVFATSTGCRPACRLQNCRYGRQPGAGREGGAGVVRGPGRGGGRRRHGALLLLLMYCSFRNTAL